MRASPPKWVGLLCALGAIVFGVYGTLFWWVRDRGPSPEAVAAAAQVVLDDHENGDLIFIVPHYATRALEHLGHLDALAVRHPLAEDLRTRSRIWVVAMFDAAAQLQGQFLTAGLALRERWSIAEGLHVDLYDHDASQRILHDFRKLQAVQISHHTEEGEVACEREPTGRESGAALPPKWRCSKKDDWFHVAPEWHHMGGHLRLCLWAHPPVSGELVLQYMNVPLGGLLWGRAGHTLHASTRAQAPVHLDVTVGSAQAQRFTFDVDARYEPFALTTSSTGTSTVTFAVSTSNNGANHFCFEAETRGPR